MAKKTLTTNQGVPVSDNQTPLWQGSMGQAFSRIST